MHSIPVASLMGVSHPAAGQIADAIHRTLLPEVDPAAADVPGRVAHAWRLWQGSSTEKTAVAAVLPDLLTDARAAARVLDGEARRQAYADLAQAYHLTQSYTSYQPSAELVWLAAGLGMAAAQESESPTAIAAAAWYRAEVHRTTGDADAAEGVAADCSTLLNPHAGGEQLAAFGVLNLALARAHSQRGNDGVAWRHWDIASDAADALGPSYTHPWLLGFSRFTVEWFGVAVGTDLFRAGEAIRRSEAVNLDDMPSQPKRAAYLMEVARAYLQRREYMAVVYLLNQAHRESSETVKHRPFARQTLLELASEQRGIVRGEARKLATAVGLLS
jgi:hypothetical protein